MKKYYDKKLLFILVGVIILIISLVFYLRMDTNEKDNEITFNITTEEISTTKKEKNYIDIKGSVKNPGVYEFKENMRVIDAINMAGGLKKNANTNNINLSQKLTSEMVIYVYSDNEIKKGNNALSCNTICETNIIEVNNCVEENTSDTNNSNNSDNTLININTASITELQTLSGIGEAKAQNIIDYRTEFGNFKSIEEIKNISGIGDALFDKIKDKITV